MTRMPRPAPAPALLAAAAALAVAPAVANARKSPLLDQPAVRHKYELRQLRFEVAPTFEGSIGAEYQHTLSAGIKAEYHLSDTLSAGGLLLFGGALDTGLFQEIKSSLPTPADPDQYPTPDTAEAEAHVNKMPLHGGMHATFTPWFGKMSVFGKAFVTYDVYVSGGLGFAKTTNSFSGNDDQRVCDRSCDDPDPVNHVYDDPRNDGPSNAGFNLGLQFGGGIHVFINKWIAVDLSIRDYMFSDNPSGFDFDHDLDVDGDDPRFMSHLFAGVGVSLYLPPKVKVSP